MGDEKRLSIRVEKEIKDRLKMIEEQTGLTETMIVRECVKAFLAEFEAQGRITLPFKIVPEDSKTYRLGEERPLKVAEDKVS